MELRDVAILLSRATSLTNKHTNRIAKIVRHEWTRGGVTIESANKTTPHVFISYGEVDKHWSINTPIDTL